MWGCTHTCAGKHQAQVPAASPRPWLPCTASFLCPSAETTPLSEHPSSPWRGQGPPHMTRPSASGTEGAAGAGGLWKGPGRCPRPPTTMVLTFQGLRPGWLAPCHLHGCRGAGTGLWVEGCLSPLSASLSVVPPSLLAWAQEVGPGGPEQVDGEKQAFSEVHNSSSNPCLPGFSEPHSKPSAPLAAAWAWSPCWLLWGLGHSWPWKLVW